MSLFVSKKLAVGYNRKLIMVQLVSCKLRKFIVIREIEVTYPFGYKHIFSIIQNPG